MQDVELEMERLTLDALPPHASGSASTIRGCQSGDEIAWRRIQTEADRYNTITSSLFTDQFDTNTSEHSRRILFAVSPNGEAVSTSAAWWGSSPSDIWGRVHWVAVLPEWQRRGIGRGLLVATCHRLKELGHKKAFLTTSPVRLEALHLYVSLGFFPRITGPGDREVWREIASSLRDPLLNSWLDVSY
jgi:GNAT superfamily N-acetyltransferase